MVILLVKCRYKYILSILIVDNKWKLYSVGYLLSVIKSVWFTQFQQKGNRFGTVAYTIVVHISD